MSSLSGRFPAATTKAVEAKEKEVGVSSLLPAVRLFRADICNQDPDVATAEVKWV